MVNRRIRGIRDIIPPGYVIGRLKGQGPPELIKISDLLRGAGAPSVVTPPTPGIVFSGARLHLTANEAEGIVAWDAADFDTHGYWAASPNPSRITIPAGVTKVILTAGMNTAAATGSIEMNINKNGSNFVGIDRPDTTGTDFTQDTTGVIEVVAGDYFEVSTNTPAAEVTNANSSTFFCIQAVEHTLT